jgi:hypothetical protein
VLSGLQGDVVLLDPVAWLRGWHRCKAMSMHSKVQQWATALQPVSSPTAVCRSLMCCGHTDSEVIDGDCGGRSKKRQSGGVGMYVVEHCQYVCFVQKLALTQRCKWDA